MKSPLKTCTASDISVCGTRQETKTHCNKHYDQIRRYGKPQLTVADRRPAIVVGEIAKIPLGLNAKDGYALVDASDSWLDKHNWSLASTGYAQTNINGQVTLMHSILVDRPKGKDIDHININPLDNRKSNLRVVSHAENMYNLPIASNNTSGARGISLDKRRNKWYAQIQKDSKHIFLGYFDSIEEAKEARQSAERKLFVYTNGVIIPGWKQV